MQSTTYTVLVTVVHGEKGHSSSRISEAIQQALEEGTSDYPGFYAAQVDAFKGNMIGGGAVNIDHAKYSRCIPLHEMVGKP